MPLRTVKTVLQQVVSVYGESVHEKLDLVDMGEQSFVYAYLNRLLNHSHSGSTDMAPAHSSNQRAPANVSSPTSRPDGDRSNGRPSKVVPSNSALSSPEMNGKLRNSLSPNSQSADIELNQRLKEIFERIGDVSTSKQVIFMLMLMYCVLLAFLRVSMTFTNSVRRIPRPRHAYKLGSQLVRFSLSLLRNSLNDLQSRKTFSAILEQNYEKSGS